MAAGAAEFVVMVVKLGGGVEGGILRAWGDQGVGMWLFRRALATITGPIWGSPGLRLQLTGG